jgi:hypothetical protein
MEDEFVLILFMQQRRYADVTSAAKKASYASSTCSGNTLVYTASASTMPVGIA